MSFPIGDDEISNFRSKYASVHPLVFHRSLEKANSYLDLFEILESLPKKPPFSWSEEKRAWIPDSDVMASISLKSMMKRKS